MSSICRARVGTGTRRATSAAEKAGDAAHAALIDARGFVGEVVVRLDGMAGADEVLEVLKPPPLQQFLLQDPVAQGPRAAGNKPPPGLGGEHEPVPRGSQVAEPGQGVQQLPGGIAFGPELGCRVGRGQRVLAQRLEHPELRADQHFGWISQRRASPSMAATSASVSAKPNRSMFAAIRSWRADFGITVMPCSRCQRSTTCAAVTPCAAAIPVSAGSSRRVSLSGLYPSKAMPRSAWSASTAGS